MAAARTWNSLPPEVTVLEVFWRYTT